MSIVESILPLSVGHLIGTSRSLLRTFNLLIILQHVSQPLFAAALPPVGQLLPVFLDLEDLSLHDALLNLINLSLHRLLIFDLVLVKLLRASALAVLIPTARRVAPGARFFQLARTRGEVGLERAGGLELKLALVLEVGLNGFAFLARALPLLVEGLKDVLPLPRGDALDLGEDSLMVVLNVGI